MDLILVGSDAERARLRALLPEHCVVVAEAPTLADARTEGGAADAFLVPTVRHRPSGRTGGADALTPRERDVLTLLADGLPNKRIAARLAISTETVKSHVAAICGKLGAANRTQAVRLALRRGLVTI